ncbi:hypothetical protein WDA79_19585 [Streptomyces sp. A475]|uniref:hypothetical protein n=1 Tax=Streptomyces sp. A475 TaxID=3131976 RepID=UPI0030C9FCA6
MIDHIHKNNSAHAYWTCTDSSGNPLVRTGSYRRPRTRSWQVGLPGPPEPIASRR